jgi:hypothetical protein
LFSGIRVLHDVHDKEWEGIIPFFALSLSISVIIGFFHNLWPFFAVLSSSHSLPFFVCHLFFSLLFARASQERVCYEKCQALEDNRVLYRRQRRYDHLMMILRLLRFFRFFFSSSSNCWHNTTTKFRAREKCTHAYISSEHWLCFLLLSSTSSFKYSISLSIPWMCNNVSYNKKYTSGIFFLFAFIYCCHSNRRESSHRVWMYLWCVADVSLENEWLLCLFIRRVYS